MKTFKEFLIEKYLVNENKPSRPVFSDVVNYLTSNDRPISKPAKEYKTSQKLRDQSKRYYEQNAEDIRKKDAARYAKRREARLAQIKKRRENMTPEEREAYLAKKRQAYHDTKILLTANDLESRKQQMKEYKLKVNRIVQLKKGIEQGTISDEDLNDLRNLVISKPSKI